MVSLTTVLEEYEAMRESEHYATAQANFGSDYSIMVALRENSEFAVKAPLLGGWIKYGNFATVAASHHPSVTEGKVTAEHQQEMMQVGAARQLEVIDTVFAGDLDAYEEFIRSLADPLREPSLGGVEFLQVIGEEEAPEELLQGWFGEHYEDYQAAKAQQTNMSPLLALAKIAEQQPLVPRLQGAFNTEAGTEAGVPSPAAEVGAEATAPYVPPEGAGKSTLVSQAKETGLSAAELTAMQSSFDEFFEGLKNGEFDLAQLFEALMAIFTGKLQTLFEDNPEEYGGVDPEDPKYSGAAASVLYAAGVRGGETPEGAVQPEDQGAINAELEAREAALEGGALAAESAPAAETVPEPEGVPTSSIGFGPR